MAIDSVGNQKTIQEIIDDSSKRTGARNTGELGKDDFLNLLVTQLRYQDPLKPVDDKEFISQMAQFTSLEQMQNMNGSLNQSQAYSLIGKHVTATLVDEEKNETNTIEGDVTGVKVAGGKTFVVVRGEDVPIERISDVTDGIRSQQNSNLSNYTDLIGFKVKGGVYDPKTANIVGVNGIVKEVQKGVYEDYAVMDDIKFDLSEIVTDVPSTDPNFIKNYLDANCAKNNNGKGNEVEVVVVDRETGQKVPVKAILDSYTVTNGSYSGVLDNVYVPVESITNITTKPQQTAQNSTTQQNGTSTDTTGGTQQAG